MQEFRRYSEKVQQAYANISSAPLSDFRRTLDAIPNCRPKEEDFNAAMKKAKAQTFIDKTFSRDSRLDQAAMLRVAAELDKAVNKNINAQLDRLAAEAAAMQAAQDRVLERQAQFRQAEENRAALLAIEVLRKEFGGGSHE